MQGQDLASGNLTAPVVYGLQTSVGPELGALIKDGFGGEFGQDRLSRALQLVKLSGGLDAARALARREADEVRSPSCCSAAAAPSLHHEPCRRTAPACPVSLDCCSTPRVQACWAGRPRDSAMQALEALSCLPESPAKQSLVLMVDYVLDRLY